MKKILVIYYSQSGQVFDICKSVFSEIDNFYDIEITYKQIKPIPEYPFPWTFDSFFDVFPESVSLKPCKLDNSEFILDVNYDLIVLAGQVWYLSPSIPVNSFLQSKEARQLLQNKPVITIYGIRNMWISAHRNIKNLILDAGGKIIGNIVFSDQENNLVSVITIVRWLIHGQKEAKGIWPSAGVSDNDISEAYKFGRIIFNSLLQNNFDNLQDKLLQLGAVKIDYVIMKIELNGSKIFKIWNKKILKQGNLSMLKRKRRLKLFKYYLYFVIFVISPFASLFFKIKKLFLNKKVKNEIAKKSEAVFT